LDAFMQMQDRIGESQGEAMVREFMSGNMRTGRSKRSKFGFGFGGRDGGGSTHSMHQRRRELGYRSNSSITSDDESEARPAGHRTGGSQRGGRSPVGGGPAMI
jgi:hypothetical protein